MESSPRIRTRGSPGWKIPPKNNHRRLSDSCARSYLPLQELQGLLIEFLHLLVQRRVRAALKDHELGAADAFLHRISETRSQHIVAAERDLCWRLDPAELRFHVMSDHS